MTKSILIICIKIFIKIANASYGIEGINALLLIMPAKLIAPTLREYGAVIGENAILHSPLMIHNAGENYANLKLGNNVYFGRAVFLDLKDKIVIGDNATISMKVTLLTHTDVGEGKLKKNIPPSSAPIEINADAYVGANATIAEGVKVGEGAVIGACSFVRKNVAPHTIVVGVPAREIKRLNG